MKASFRMAPLVSVVGRDRYRDGEGSLQMRVLSLVPVANKTGGGLNQGDLLRYLGELQWFPAGALADYIMWEEIDAHSARATMSYGGIAASMTFVFGAEGRLLEERAIRYNDARGKNEPEVTKTAAELMGDADRAAAASPDGARRRDGGQRPGCRWSRLACIAPSSPSRPVSSAQAALARRTRAERDTCGALGRQTSGD